jgi:uncharacterized membrane protein
MTTGFLRTEVWHALSVHFPIALLLFSTLTRVVSFFLRNENVRFWRSAANGLLYSGTIAAWISIYTGNQADGIVARKICDPTILKDHEIAGQITTYLFTAAAVLSLIALSRHKMLFIRKIAFIVIVILSLAGSVGLVYTGHLGASLVYEQGAGVKGHEVDCSE